MRLCHGRNFNKNLLCRGILFTCLIVEMMIQVKSQHFGHGRCPRTSRAPPVNIRRYIARPWYYIYSFDNILEVGNICSREDLSLKSNGNINKVTTAIRNFKETNIEGSAVLNRSGNGGLLTIKLRNGLLPGGNLLTRRNEILNKLFITVTYSFPYVILETDYDDYSVAYSCAPFMLGTNIQFSWILSRKRTLSRDSIVKVKSALSKYGISTSSYYSPYKAQHQINCP